MTPFLGGRTPVWFSLFRLAVVAGVLIWVGTDAIWKPVAEETAAAVAEAREQLAKANAAAAVHNDLTEVQFNGQQQHIKEHQHGHDIRARR